MSFKHIAILYLVVYSYCSTDLVNICNQITNKGLLPDNIARDFNEYLIRVQQRNQERKEAIMLIGMIGSLFLGPLVAPLFAAPGLYGAAAMSSGLAALGGGSIAAGGFGMLGGQIVLGLTGHILTKSAASVVGNEASFTDFMTTKNNKFNDKMIIGNYYIDGKFSYNNGKIYLDGKTTIYYDNRIMFDGFINKQCVFKY